MRLYSTTGVTHLSNEDHGDFEVDEDGGFELPHELGEQLRNTHIGGQKAWEDDGERSLRLVAEEDARRRDPASMYELMEKLVNREPVEEPKKATGARKQK